MRKEMLAKKAIQMMFLSFALVSCSTGGESSLQPPVSSEDGRTITYGLYPQTLISDTTLIDALNALPQQNGWCSLGDEYYVKVTAKPYSNDMVFSNGAKCQSDAKYWFKVEPIKWKVLSAENGDYFVTSECILDTQIYNEYYFGTDDDGNYANCYKASDIRAWLNGEFLDQAFHGNDSFIKTTLVDNSVATTGYKTNRYGCENTNDKIFLLSLADITNAEYGFIDAPERACAVSDYAIAKGAYKNQEYNSGYWWTRSPSADYSNTVTFVYFGGGITGESVQTSGVGVRPAMNIHLN